MQGKISFCHCEGPRVSRQPTSPITTGNIYLRPNLSLPLRHLDTNMQRRVSRGCEHVDVRLVLHEQLDAFAVPVSARFMQRGHSFSRRIVYQFVCFLIVDDVGATLCDRRRQNSRHRLCLPCSHEASAVILVLSKPSASGTHAACLHSPPDAKRSLATTRLAHLQRPCAHKVVPLPSTRWHHSVRMRPCCHQYRFRNHLLLQIPAPRSLQPRAAGYGPWHRLR